MEGKITTIIISAIISSEVIVFLFQNWLFANRIKKLEQKLEQDNETFRYRFREQRKMEAALVDTMEEVRRSLKPIEGWLNDKADDAVRNHFYSYILGKEYIDEMYRKAELMSKVFRNNYILDDDVRAVAIVAFGSFHSATGAGSLLVFNSTSKIALDDTMLEQWKKEFCKNYGEATQKLDAIKVLVRKKMGVAEV